MALPANTADSGRAATPIITSCQGSSGRSPACALTFPVEGLPAEGGVGRPRATTRSVKQCTSFTRSETTTRGAQSAAAVELSRCQGRFIVSVAAPGRCPSRDNGARRDRCTHTRLTAKQSCSVTRSGRGDRTRWSGGGKENDAWGLHRRTRKQGGLHDHESPARKRRRCTWHCKIDEERPCRSPAPPAAACAPVGVAP